MIVLWERVEPLIKDGLIVYVDMHAVLRKLKKADLPLLSTLLVLTARVCLFKTKMSPGYYI